jgi:cytochrome c553
MMIKALTPLPVLPALVLALAGMACVAASAQAQPAPNPAEGEKKAAMCMGCHSIIGYQASFPQVHKVPKISGQNAKYMVAALNEYKKGDRKHPTMRAIAGSLTDQDMADLAAFFESQGASSLKTVADTTPPAPSAEVGALLAKGACSSCHGANFNKPIDAGYPKLAGQHPDYLYVALKAYGTEGNPQVGRGNAIMGAQVKQFKHEELKAIADYLGSLPGDVRTVPESRFR